MEVSPPQHVEERREVFARLVGAQSRAKLLEGGLPSSEPERAREALERHLRGRPLPKDRKALERIGMYLMRRGFDAETARATIRAAGAETDDDSP